MNRKLISLAIERAKELGQQAFDIHQNMEIWRPEPLSMKERTEWSVQLDRSMKQQRLWLDAVLKEIEKEREGDE